MCMITYEWLKKSIKKYFKMIQERKKNQKNEQHDIN